MTSLIYHRVNNGATSPFDEAILRVAENGPLKVVSPFIGVDYLLRIIGMQDDWSLISDIEAWLASLPTRARLKAWLFLTENLDRIHHCPAIHAKTVIGQSLAYLGSANLTSTGILARAELGALIDEAALVAELHAWFDEQWEQTASPSLDEASAYVKWLDDEARNFMWRGNKQQVTSPATRVRAKLAKQPLGSASGKALDLSSVAKKMIEATSRAQKVLRSVVEDVLNASGEQYISLQGLWERVRQELENTTRFELLEALLPFCANHPRSVFSSETDNRLVIIDGVFYLATAENVVPALTPFDAFLAVVIHHLDFDEARALPDANHLHDISGVKPAKQVFLVASLTQSGLLYGGDGYLLSEDFDWPKRYRLFQRGYAKWNERLDARRNGLRQPAPSFIAPLSKVDEKTHISREEAIAARGVSKQTIMLPTLLAVPGAVAGVEREFSHRVPTGKSEQPEAAHKPESIEPAVEYVVPRKFEAPTVIKNKEKLRAEALMGQEAISAASARADKIFFELLLVVAKEGPVFATPSLTMVAGRLRNSVSENTKIITKILTGAFPGAPHIFQVVVMHGYCFVRLLDVTPAERKRLPNAIRGLDSLSEAELADLRDPYAYKFRKDSERPIRRRTPIEVDHQALYEREHERKQMRAMNAAEKVYGNLIRLLAQANSNFLSFGTMSALSGVVCDPLSQQVAQNVLIGSYQGVPRLFSFDFGHNRTHLRCRVLLLAVRDETLDLLPHTKAALEGLSDYMQKLLAGVRFRKPAKGKKQIALALS